MDCPFCTVPPERLVWQAPAVMAFRDHYPLSDGHTLVVPRRHVETYFEATLEEQTAIWTAVSTIKQALDLSHHPDGYNVGFNVGAAAGQTVMHLHVHVIPRYRGDLPDPRGGIRWVLPGKAAYWAR
jgi:diadenosine tetraphosphate (Ap4A) HIT family hydrolase